jgi:hypothetical protein
MILQAHINADLAEGVKKGLEEARIRWPDVKSDSRRLNLLVTEWGTWSKERRRTERLAREAGKGEK